MVVAFKFDDFGPIRIGLGQPDGQLRNVSSRKGKPDFFRTVNEFDQHFGNLCFQFVLPRRIPALDQWPHEPPPGPAWANGPESAAPNQACNRYSGYRPRRTSSIPSAWVNESGAGFSRDLRCEDTPAGITFIALS